MEPTRKDAPTIRRTRVEFSSPGSPRSGDGAGTRGPNPGAHDGEAYEQGARPVDAYVEVPSVDDSSTKQQIRVAPGHSEEVQRVHVEEEDRLAFRVGVNILTLALIGLGVYLVWRNFFQ